MTAVVRWPAPILAASAVVVLIGMVALSHDRNETHNNASLDRARPYSNCAAHQRVADISQELPSEEALRLPHNRTGVRRVSVEDPVPRQTLVPLPTGRAVRGPWRPTASACRDSTVVVEW